MNIYRFLWKYINTHMWVKKCKHFLLFFLLLGLLILPIAHDVHAADLLIADFDTDENGFSYSDDTFLSTSQPGYASGSRVTGSECYGGSGGCLNVTLGGINNNTITDMSGGWRYTLNLGSSQSGVSLIMRYRLVMPAVYDYDEYSRVLVSLDGTLFGRGSKDYIDHTGGDNTFAHDTDWMQTTLYLGDLSAGNHNLIFGGFSNKKNSSSEITDIYFDDISITSDNAAPITSDTQVLINRLDIDTFKDNIETLSDFGDRCHRPNECEPFTSYFNAQNWVEDQLESWGYETFTHSYVDGSYEGVNLYATKVGTVHPDQMYIIAGHLDGRGGGGAADDNGSTISLLMELARVLASPDIETEISVRFIFWDQEEWGLYGSENYVDDRSALQGIEDPPGSGLYPEPTWLGNITHDMILYDHGVGSTSTEQSPYADLDVEWRRSTAYEAQSKELAQLWRFKNGDYAPDYPANSADYSTNTDDTPFHNECPSISVRENRRSLSGEWINPYYHQTGDVYTNYIEDDFLLGFNAVQTTMGLIADLAGASIIVTNNPPSADSQSVITDEDNVKAITLTGSDPDSDPITFAIDEHPNHGTLTGAAPDLTYTPDANYSGSDSFTFIVNDGTLDSAPATVSITINPVNDPPTAHPQSVITNINTPILITLTGSDIENNPLTYSIDDPPDHGGLSGTPPNLTYTPDTDFNGADSYTFYVSDGSANSASATISITVAYKLYLPFIIISSQI